MESIKNPEQDKEELFKSWLTEFQGKFWLNTDVMPKNVYEALQMYKHWNTHGGDKNEEVVKKMEEASANFKKLTNYDIQDFLNYQDEQNRKLTTDKK